MKTSLALGVATATAAAGLTVGAALPAAADADDGTLVVHVVADRDRDGLLQPGVDSDIADVVVTATDAGGTVVSGTTGADGTVSIDTTTLIGGAYRVEVTNPDPAMWSEAYIVDDRASNAAALAPAVSFVDIAGGTDATVNVGSIDYSVLGPDHGTIFSAVQDNMEPGRRELGQITELYTLPMTLDEDPTPITRRGELGNLYGVAVDAIHDAVFVGAYAKRGADYGEGGPGGIYRYDLETGDVGLWTQVDDAGTTAHDWDTLEDFEFRTAVGNESLGDLEVTADGRWLTAVNLNTDSLVTYSTLDPADVSTLAVAPPADCNADWTPFALGERPGEAGLYVGATCGATMEVYLLHFDRDAATGELSNQALVAQGNADDVAARHDDGNNMGANQYLNPLCSRTVWHAWADDVDQRCIDDYSERWFEQKDENDPELITNWGAQLTYAQPMLADLAFTNAGELILSFRDRASDMYLGQARGGPETDWVFSGATYGQRTDGAYVSGKYVTTGDVVRTVIDGTALTFPAENDFQDGVTAPGTGVHRQGSFAGMAYVPSGDYVVSNQLDANNYYTQGVRIYDAATGAINDRFPEDTTRSGIDLTNNFDKNAGLADIEVLVREAPQQIGDYIWIDLDGDGVQDPDEIPVPGVRVYLYDADGQPVTDADGQPVWTETDVLGEYHFGTADGIEPSTGYQVRIDPAAFADGGPLQGTVPTITGGGTTTTDNNGVPDADGIVTATVTTPVYGANDYSIDFGFRPVVSIGDYLWVDADSDGRQGDDELPVPQGTQVQLFDAGGTLVDTATTDEHGYYAFVGLTPERDYTVVFPTELTVDGVAHRLTGQHAPGVDPADDSNADPTTGEAPVTTPAWEQGVSRNSGEPEQADDPTIDAGYAPVPVSIGDYVWLDENGNGSQDDFEPALPNVPVQLLDPDTGAVIDEVPTGDDGYYVFPDLPAGRDYVVRFPTTIEHEGRAYRLTTPGTDPASNTDSNADPDDGTAPVTTPPDGENLTERERADDPTIDAGYVLAPVVVPPTTVPPTTVPPTTQPPVPPTSPTVPPTTGVMPPPDGNVAPPGPAAPPNGGLDLPATGSNVTTISLIALLAIVLGAGALTLRRRAIR